MDVFDLRNSLIQDYYEYISSFIQIKDQRILDYVANSLEQGLLWPPPLIQLNPSFKPGQAIDQLVSEGILHPDCKRIFRRGKSESDLGKALQLHQHQEDAIRVAQTGQNYVLTTGTGSGKSLAYIIPIVNHILKHGSGKGIQAIIVYPMNALANSQQKELEKFLNFGLDGQQLVRFERYTGQENDLEKERILANPPDILLTNYVMLELILTRPKERASLVSHAQGLRFLVLDELHTYRGRQGADVSLLVRRAREALHATRLQCIGTSATLAGVGSLEQQRKEVAEVATMLFGSPVPPENVIGETLQRATPERNDADLEYQSELADSIQNLSIPDSYDAFIKHPLAAWLESHLGLNTDPESGRLVRAKPRSLIGPKGIARELAQQTGLDEQICAGALQAILIAGYNIKKPENGFSTFAFRLHQFISRGDTIYASLEDELERHITAYGQKYVPNERGTILLPLAFCRECGQEYYVVWRTAANKTKPGAFLTRELGDSRSLEQAEAGFLYRSSKKPWSDTTDACLDRLPDDWLEERNGEIVVKSSQRKNLPETIKIMRDGTIGDTGDQYTYVSAPFRFCLNCGVSYSGRQLSDFAKLTGLSSGGRSTDTTILSLSLIRQLREDTDLHKEARKLLSFTDNRQDASLQAGHFNDFIEIALLRSALYRAVKAHEESGGVTHEMLPHEIFQALNLPLSAYATEPEVRFAQKVETERALREILAYRIYRDLKRGWRITSPNLEQCGLLQIDYSPLDELCAAEDVWQNSHSALATATPETRQQVARVLLDYMRRELAIKVSYLDQAEQERLRQLSSQYLIAPWALDESEDLTHAAILFPRPRLRDQEEYGGNLYLSPRGGYGQFLRRNGTFPDFPTRLSVEETQEIIEKILDSLRIGGLVEILIDAKDDLGHKLGYQLRAASMTWKVGAGTRAFHDPIRVPQMPEDGGKTNAFFVDFYRNIARNVLGIEAREHTAQVPAKERQNREDLFRDGNLPILFCSPTMELGVDISELNAVNMRNVPPTPANYAQRSGRAGRSGQPALVFTYCTIGSAHDQYYFRRPELMVAGSVTPPRIDLTNQDLIRSHVQAIWLAEAGTGLGNSLKEILDLSGDTPSLECLDHIQDALNSQSVRSRAKLKAQAVLLDIENLLQQVDWWNEGWLDSVLAQIDLEFNRACERWRSLYRAAKNQQRVQHAIVNDNARGPQDRRMAQRLRQEAESQLDLLTEAENIVQSDFYSYRYFASEGFLPGYSFPRLPLSAFLPARRIKKQNDEFLSRPRFLAISEFGPRAIIYHEGSRYTINKVSLPVSDDEEGIATARAKQCLVCGYLHPIQSGDGVDRCERCGALLEAPISNLFRLQNVSTKRRDRISSDEEERQRQGYELRTALRFADHGGVVSAKTAEIHLNGEILGKLTYGHAATLWRINLGWRRRANPNQHGFMLNVETGYWERQSEDDAPADGEDPTGGRKKRVVPFVEDHKNSLLFEPTPGLEIAQMASLQAALKNAIQVEYQLEDDELAAEPLPGTSERRLILFYESAEGGAGVLRRLVEDPEAFGRVMRQALKLCHFDPQTGEDLHRAPGAPEDCEAACYNCLMSYTNQMDHHFLDRQSIRDFLMRCAQAKISVSPQTHSRADHLQSLLNACESDLEREWLALLEKNRCRLPSHAQHYIEACRTRPDFYYEPEHTAIYVDGPHHLYPERQARDRDQTDCMENTGYTVIHFGLQDDWLQIIKRYPSIFGGFNPA